MRCELPMDIVVAAGTINLWLAALVTASHLSPG